MKKKYFIYLSGVLFLIIGAIAQCSNSSGKNADLNPKKELKVLDYETPRNVIFILSDDHRYDYMGFTKKVPWLKTPNMDRMASNGVYMENAFVTTSLCSPSRASILTGQFSHVHTIVDNQAPHPGNLTFFPEYLQSTGYETAFFGKWHMGDESDDPKPGFDHWESFKGQGEYYNPTLNINGTRTAYKDSTYVTDLLTDHAISWLENRDKNKPYFLYLSHKGVHAEFMPAKRHKGQYKGKKLVKPETYHQTLTNEYKELKWPEWVKLQRHSWHGVDYMYHDSTDLDAMVVDYCETLLSIDESIGAVLDYLEKTSQDKNTLVIYMGDNGFSWGEHGLIDKRHFYEESVKVPLLVHCPEIIEGGTTINSMIQNIDIAPTVLECARLQKPDYMPGESFIRLFNGDNKNWRDRIFYEYYWEYDFPMTPTVYGVRTDSIKYIRYQGIWDRNELYNLKNDPDEKYNLIDDPGYQETAKKLAIELYDWLEHSSGMQIPLKRTIKYRFGDYKHANQY
jgi:arylsulfatase A-like enzyme